MLMYGRRNDGVNFGWSYSYGHQTKEEPAPVEVSQAWMTTY